MPAETNNVAPTTAPISHPPTLTELQGIKATFDRVREIFRFGTKKGIDITLVDADGGLSDAEDALQLVAGYLAFPDDQRGEAPPVTMSMDSVECEVFSWTREERLGALKLPSVAFEVPFDGKALLHIRAEQPMQDLEACLAMIKDRAAAAGE